MPRNPAILINSPCLRPTLRVLILILLSLPGFLSLPRDLDAAEPGVTKGVLVLWVDQPGQVFDLELVRGLRSKLQTDSTPLLAVYSEYLELASINHDSYKNELPQLLKAKYSQKRMDLIVIPGIIIDPFLVKLRDEVWPNTPVIVAGLFPDSVSSLNLGLKVIGITGAFDLKGTLAEALKLLPETRHVAFVNGTNVTGQIMRRRFDQDFQTYADRIRLIDLMGQSVEELKVSLVSLPENTIVLFLAVNQDRDGQSYRAWDVASVLIPLSKAPVFNVYTTWIEHGIVGGVLMDPRKMGQEVGGFAVRILGGEQFDDGAIIKGNWNQLTLNWRQLQKWKISEDKASPEALILFKEPSVWEKYRWQIVSIIAFTLFQSLLIAGLVIGRIKNQRYQRILNEQIRFETFAADLSASLANLPIDQVDQEIERWLGRLTDFLAVDLGQLLEYSEDGQALSVVYSSGSPSAPSGWPVKPDDQMSWYAQQMRSSSVLRLSRLPDDLPAEAASEREYTRTAGLRSNLSIPLRVEGSVQNVLSFSSFGKAREWPDDMVNRLRVVGETLATAIAHKRTTESTTQLRAELFRISRVTTMGELAASIAHEVNQPLFAILTSANAGRRWLKIQPPNLDEARENFELISEEGRRASDVITRIRALLKKGQLTSAQLNLNEVINSVALLVQTEMFRRHIVLRTDLADGLAEVSGDRVQLQQVLLNLIINGADSIDLSNNGRRELVISSSHGENGDVLVSVRDSGTGVDPEAQDRIFEAFYTTKPQGMGMGLSINRTIIEAHHGKLWAENNDGPGATFRFSLPASSEVEK